MKTGGISGKTAVMRKNGRNSEGNGRNVEKCRHFSNNLFVFVLEKGGTTLWNAHQTDIQIYKIDSEK